MTKHPLNLDKYDEYKLASPYDEVVRHHFEDEVEIPKYFKSDSCLYKYIKSEYVSVRVTDVEGLEAISAIDRDSVHEFYKSEPESFKEITEAEFKKAYWRVFVVLTKLCQ